MANWQLFEPRGGIIRWKEKNDTLFNNGEDFVCYAFYPIKVNMDVVVGEIEWLTFEEYHSENPYIRYGGE